MGESVIFRQATELMIAIILAVPVLGGGDDDDDAADVMMLSAVVFDLIMVAVCNIVYISIVHYLLPKFVSLANNERSVGRSVAVF